MARRETPTAQGAMRGSPSESVLASLIDLVHRDATHIRRRQVAPQTRKRRAAGRNAPATRKQPASAAKAPPERKKRENLTTATITQADLSRHALELKLSHPAPSHPGSGPAASQGKKSKESQKPLRVGASKGEVGRVSQEGKVAQARKDSADR